MFAATHTSMLSHNVKNKQEEAREDTPSLGAAVICTVQTV